jgi:type IV pilus assembly protein PilC
MEAVGEAAVMAQLRAQMITPIAVKAKRKDLLEGVKLFKQGPNTRDLVIFTRQFATMIDAGLPLVQCLAIQADQQPKAGFKEVILSVKSEVEQGSTFADALGKHPKTCSPTST